MCTFEVSPNTKGMRTAGLNVDEKIDSLQINCESKYSSSHSLFSPRSFSNSNVAFEKAGISQCEPDCGLWTFGYKRASSRPSSGRSAILKNARRCTAPPGGKMENGPRYQGGPTYTIFPRPANAPDDVVPLVYEDYFGPSNVAGWIRVLRTACRWRL